MIYQFSAIEHVATVPLRSAAGNTAALLTIPPAFPSEIISEHAWQKQLTAVKHVSSKAKGLGGWAPNTATLRPALSPDFLFAQGLNASY